jgi:hypothetical protein
MILENGNTKAALEDDDIEVVEDAKSSNRTNKVSINGKTLLDFQIQKLITYKFLL